MIRAFRIVQRNGMVYRRTWRGSLFTGFLQPALFLLSIGLGVGTLVDRGGAQLPGEVGYLAFLAPGLLAGACMQTATFESSWPILAKLTWGHNYEAIASTPLGILDIVIGELAWVGVRLTMVATAYMVVMTAFAVPRSLLAILAVPAAALTGLAFSAAIMAYAATIRNNGTNFNAMFRFIITPLFLFSGTFFPVTRLPPMLQTIAVFTPLYHGVALTRGLTLGTIDSRSWIGHVVYLLAMCVVGVVTAIWTFTRKMTA